MFIGKIIIIGEIEIKTGLRIGGSSSGLKIGGVDLNVITDAFGKPYIPGSSLKGKMRSLMEHKLGKLTSDGKVHVCKNNEDYSKCAVCLVWGIPPADREVKITLPVYTRLIIRDVPLDEKSIANMKNLELTYTEVKVENAINRKNSSATPRQIERVPAGAVFSPMEIIYNVYEDSDKGLLRSVFEAMELLEDDYLGGMGSRGYGKIKFKNIKIYWNKKEDYETGKLNKTIINDGHHTPSSIIENFDEISKKMQSENTQ